MALEATHIRFALDLKDKYRISEIEKYIAGTIYPDSRYVTGIERSLTHPADYSEWRSESLSDFKKGWMIHLLVDKMQWRVTKERLPEVFEGKAGQGSEVWIKHTAIKILQDIDDVNKFDIRPYLSVFEYAENPNGENIDVIRKYNKIFFAMYAEPSKVDIDSCYWMWKEFGIEEALASKIKAQAESYMNDRNVMTQVKEIYQDVLDRIYHHGENDQDF